MIHKIWKKTVLWYHDNIALKFQATWFHPLYKSLNFWTLERTREFGREFANPDKVWLWNNEKVLCNRDDGRSENLEGRVLIGRHISPPQVEIRWTGLPKSGGGGGGAMPPPLCPPLPPSLCKQQQQSNEWQNAKVKYFKVETAKKIEEARNKKG